jgi:hypothetical protein
VVKVRLSDLTRVGALTLNTGEDELESAVIDPAAGFAYFGTRTSPGQVVQVHLSDLTRASALTLNRDEDGLTAAVIDPAAGFAYFGTYTDPGRVVRINLGRCDDFNGNGRVDSADVQAVARRWGLKPTDPGYQPQYDVVADSVINVQDIIAVRQHWREQCPP